MDLIRGGQMVQPDSGQQKDAYDNAPEYRHSGPVNMGLYRFYAAKSTVCNAYCLSRRALSGLCLAFGLDDAICLKSGNVKPVHFAASL